MDAKRLIKNIAVLWPLLLSVDSFAETGVSIDTAIREDRLQWNIAGNINGQNPNILSELTWENIKALTVGPAIRGVNPGNLYYDAYLHYGLIFAGDNQDSDYDSDNRQDEFSRSNNNSDSGSTLDISYAVGYQFGAAGDQPGFSVTPIIGFSLHQQNLEMTDGNQTVNTRSSFLGAFAGLDSSYDAEWKGPWLGLNLKQNFDKAQFLLSYEYHIVDYYAEANWNLRTDFQHPVSFTHSADGVGHVFKFSFHYQPWRRFGFGFELKRSQWETDAGIDYTFFSNGTVSSTRLNVVEWESTSIMFKPTFVF